MAALAVVWMAVAGCTSQTSPASAPPTTDATTGPAASPEPARTRAVDVDGRPFSLYTPSGAGPGAALVVVLHGYTGDAEGTVTYFGLRDAADERGFLIAAPQGTTDNDGKTFWNASRACCNFYDSDVDDSTYVSDVIATVVREAAVDPRRVFVVGHSNGGFMAHRLACDHADQIAAIASLAGAMDVGGDCAPTRAVSVLQVHGDADETISFDGGAIAGNPYTSAERTVANWQRLDGCRGAAKKSDPGIDADSLTPDVDDLAAATWAKCDAGGAVSLWTLAGSGHMPGLTPAFTTALVDWLEAHARD